MGTEGCGDTMTPECAEQFKTLNDKLDKVFTRLFVSNGQRALIERIRDNEKEIERHKQSHESADHAALEEPPDGKEAPKTIRMSVGPKGVSTQNMKPLDVFMMGVAIVAVLLLALIVLEKFGFIGG